MSCQGTLKTIKSLFSNTNHIMLTHKLAKENVIMKRKAYVSANQSFLTTIVNLSKKTTSVAQLFF